MPGLPDPRPKPEPSLYERLRGKRTRDIELPNQSGRVDSRLTRPAPRRALVRRIHDTIKALPTPGQRQLGRKR